MRYLTQLELRRLTGTRILSEQIVALDQLGIPYRSRAISTGYLLGVNVLTTDAVPRLSTLEWSTIADENIGTGLARLRETRQREVGAGRPPRTESALGAAPESTQPGKRQTA